jgi:hypothetical protein
MAKARRRKQSPKARDLAPRKRAAERVKGGDRPLVSNIQKKDSDTKSAVISNLG